MPIKLFLLLNAQKNNMLLRINLDNLNKSQSSLIKNILPSDEFIIVEKDVDLYFNIPENEFNWEFLSNQKVFLT